MKKYRALLSVAALALCFPVWSGRPTTLSDIANRLTTYGVYSDSCTYEVLLASLSEPVTYTIGLQSMPSATPDSLAPCDYLISWSLPTPSGITEGFSAYFDGSHFRFRDKRLQEYHADMDPEPFMPEGNIDRGVQCQVQFADLLPQFIGHKFAEMQADSSYIYRVSPDTIVGGKKAVVVKGVRRTSGYDGLEYTYVFEPSTMRPLRIEFENNPGQIGEQSVAVTFDGNVQPTLQQLDLNTLVALKGEAFEKYRESTFSLDNLPGRPMPEISAPTLGGERYYHRASSAFNAPTVIAFIESSVGSTPDLIAAVRRALTMSPRQVDIVWAFLDHRGDDVSPLTDGAIPGESVLIHAGGAARDCGVGAVTPVLIFANSDGTVSDFIRGYNQDLESLVIQKANLCN